MIERYSRKEIKKIWEEKNKYKIWLDLELAAAQGMEKIGIIPKGVANSIKLKAKINVKRNSQKSILKSLGFKVVNEKGDKCLIKIPSYRLDVIGEADIVEEILRIYRFDQIPLTNVIDQNTKKPVLSSELKSFYKIKRAIANSGYLEAVTFSFMDDKISKLEIPTGNPLLISFNEKNEIMKCYYLDKERAKDLIAF